MRRRDGFTLVEVLVAVAVLALITTMVWYSFAQTFKAIDIVRADSDMLRQARQVTSKVPYDISMAFLPQFPSPTSNAKYEFVTESHGDTDGLHFDALSHTKLYKDSNESDQAEVQYSLESQRARGPKGKGGLWRLLRREDPVIDDQPTQGGQTLVMAENIKAFKLWFYDPVKDDWTENWDTNRVENSNRLPYAVRLKLTMVDSDGIDHTWVSAATLRMAKTVDPR